MDAEEVRPLVVGEDEGLDLLQAIVLKELGPAATEVALPLAVMEDLNMVRWLTAAALLHDGLHHPLPFHCVNKLEG
jgi:hypothetical protein